MRQFRHAHRNSNGLKWKHIFLELAVMFVNTECIILNTYKHEEKKITSVIQTLTNRYRQSLKW